MKKIISILLAAMLLVGIALAETADVTGAWYANLYGIQVTLNVREDGTCSMDIPGEETETGVWELDGATFYIDRGSEGESMMRFDGQSLFADADGIEFLFTREPASAFEPAAARADAGLEEFSGNWVCTLIDILGMQVPPEMAEMNLELTIDGDKVTLSNTGLGSGEPATLQSAFEGGVLTATETAAEEYLDDTVYTIRLLEDGGMSVSTDFAGETITYYMSAMSAAESAAE